MQSKLVQTHPKFQHLYPPKTTSFRPHPNFDIYSIQSSTLIHHDQYSKKSSSCSVLISQKSVENEKPKFLCTKINTMLGCYNGTKGRQIHNCGRDSCSRIPQVNYGHSLIRTFPAYSMQISGFKLLITAN